MNGRNEMIEKPIGIYVIKGVCMGVLALALKMTVCGVCRLVYRDGDSIFGTL